VNEHGRRILPPRTAGKVFQETLNTEVSLRHTNKQATKEANLEALRQILKLARVTQRLRVTPPREVKARKTRADRGTPPPKGSLGGQQI